MLKKIAAGALALVLVVSLLLTFPVTRAYAQSKTKIILSVGKSEYNVGDIITVSIVGNNVIDLFGLQFVLSYDPTILKLQSSGIELNGGFENFSPNPVDTKNGVLTYALIDKTSVNTLQNTVTVGVLRFRAIEKGSAALNLTNIKAVNSNLNEIQENVKDQKILNILAARGSQSPTISITPIQRKAGIDRYETCVKISQTGWQYSDYAVLATGEEFPDALSAAPLAGKYKAPILITTPDVLTPMIESEIERLKVKNIFIIGGYGAISENIESKLIAKGIKCVRIKGIDRYETAANIAEHVGTDGKIIVATGEDFPDALSIASYAAFNRIPILLTEKDRLPVCTAGFAAGKNIKKTFVVGGPGVISNDILNALPNSERLHGIDRYATNISVLNRFASEFNLSNMYFATGINFPDALSGSALAAQTNSPIILIDDYLSPDTMNFITNSLTSIKTRWALGGEKVLPDCAIDRLFK